MKNYLINPDRLRVTLCLDILVTKLLPLIAIKDVGCGQLECSTGVGDEAADFCRRMEG